MSVLTYLSSLSGYSWACIVGAWMLLGLVAALSLGRAIKRADDEQVNRITELPPVPESDKHWLDPWPSGSHLIDVDAVHGLLSEDEVYPTADEAEQRVFDKLCDEIDRNFRVLGEAA